MRAIGCFMMVAFAVYVMWTLARALRNGVIFSDGVPYDASKQPLKYASTAALHCGGAVLFLWLAASSMPAFWLH